MKVGEDFRFRDDMANMDAGDTVPVEILIGEYSGIIFRFIRVQVVELENQAKIQFQYEILNTTEMTESQLRQDAKFIAYMGLILNMMVLELAEANSNENRKDNSKESRDKSGVHAENFPVP